MDFFNLIRQPQGLGQLSSRELQSLMQGRVQSESTPAGGLNVRDLVPNSTGGLGVMSGKEIDMLRQLKPMPYSPSMDGISGGLGQISEREYQELVRPFTPQPISEAEYEMMRRMAQGLLY